jgi:hypothetical protein
VLSTTAIGSSFAAHFRRADRVKDRGGDVAGQACQLLVALKLHAWFPELFAGWYFARAGFEATILRVKTQTGGGDSGGLRRC